MLQRQQRDEDYLEVSLDGPWRYNPLHNDMDAYAMAYGIASLVNAVFGKGKEPFWQQAYTNLVKFIILLHKVVDDYVTLFDVYECAINPDRLAEKLAEGEQKFSTSSVLVVSREAYEAHPGLRSFGLHLDPASGGMCGPDGESIRAYLTTHDVPYEARQDSTDDPRRQQLEAGRCGYG